MKTNSPSYLRHRNPDNNTPEQTPFFSKSGEGDVPAQQSGFFSAPASVIQRDPQSGAPAEEPNFTPAAPQEEPMASFPPAEPEAPMASVAPAPSMFDLFSPKITLLKRLADMSWVSDCFVGLDTDAHPAHRAAMMEALTTMVLSHTTQLGAVGGRILGASSTTELDQLGIEIDTFKAVHGVLLTKELQDVVEYYRVMEQLWVILFLNGGPITKDPTNANKGGQKALLEYHRGLTGTVKLITRVNYTWTRTPGAVTAGIADWTDAEKTQFKTGFQRQLDNVWNTRNAGAYTPFRVSEPSDYLLKNSPLKWSDITAHMQGEVRDAAAGGTPDFTITVTKRDMATESGLRAFVGSGTGQFYDDNRQAGVDATGAPTSGQQTLAHEWAHMIGQPDEYAENSAAQSQEWINGGSTGTTANSLGSDQWTACQNELNRRAGDPALTPQQQAQATTDLNSLTNHARDIDPATPGFQGGIFGVANRADNTLPLPDECFAVRGAWSGSRSIRLRPGGRSQRGGTHISASADDAARLTDRGNQVHAYHREGVLNELNDALSAQTDPRVQFEHNFQDMSTRESLETIEARLNNIRWDILALQERLASPASPETPGSVPEGERPE
jgi:hypothetical protein